MTKLLIVGAGGIGSWLIDGINNAYILNQINSELDVSLYDNDIVDLKNISYQNFKMCDILEKKVNALAKYYLIFNPVVSHITTEKELENYDIIISCVDNARFRNLLFNYVYKKDNNTYWIDLRSEGRCIAYFTKHNNNTKEKMLATLPKLIDDTSTSCQLEEDLKNNTVQWGNRIIATIGVQLLLNYLRQKVNKPEFITII